MVHMALLDGFFYLTRMACCREEYGPRRTESDGGPDGERDEFGTEGDHRAALPPATVGQARRCLARGLPGTWPFFLRMSITPMIGERSTGRHSSSLEWTMV